MRKITLVISFLLFFTWSHAQKPTGTWQFSSAHFKTNNATGVLETREFVSVDQLAIANQYNNQLFNIPIVIQFGPELFLSDDVANTPVINGLTFKTHSAVWSVTYRIEGNQIVSYIHRDTQWSPVQEFAYRINGGKLEVDYTIAADVVKPTTANCIFTCIYIQKHNKQ